MSTDVQQPENDVQAPPGRVRAALLRLRVDALVLQERYALKALRGDFDDVSSTASHP